jgi:hypothetical protein
MLKLCGSLAASALVLALGLALARPAATEMPSASDRSQPVATHHCGGVERLSA